MRHKTDRRGVEYVGRGHRGALPRGWATCGTCGRSWNDEKSTSVTPTPSGRCPFEYEHVYRSRRSNPSQSSRVWGMELFGTNACFADLKIGELFRFPNSKVVQKKTNVTWYAKHSKTSSKGTVGPKFQTGPGTSVMRHTRSNPSSYAGDPYWTRARFKGTCCKCQGVVRKGDPIYYYPKGKKVYCDGASCGKAANQDFISMRDDEDLHNRKNPSGGKVQVRVVLDSGAILVATFPRSKWPNTMNGRDSLISRAVGGSHWKRWDEITSRSNPGRDQFSSRIRSR